MNLANKITYSRIALIPVLVISFYFYKYGMLLSGIIFIIAAITDFFDGYIAKKNKNITVIGTFLDPIADKILTMSVFLLLSSINMIPAWSVIIILAREFLINGLRLIAAEKNIVIEASFLGKAKTNIQIFSLALLLLSGISNTILLTGIILYWLSFLASIISGLEYLYQRKNLLK